MRVKALESVLVMLHTVRTQLQFSAAPVGQLLESICQLESLTPLTFLPECDRLYREGEVFPLAWQKALQRCAGPLHKEDCAPLEAFGASLGTTDVCGQLQSCDLYEQLLAEHLQRARAENQKYAKLLPALGLLCGVALAIVLI